jgi:hypothetical protein
MNTPSAFRGPRTGRWAIALVAAAVPSLLGAAPSGTTYSKIANNGSVLADSATLGTGATDWACTLVNATRLVFEVKRDAPGTLRDYRNSYTWYDTDGSRNGGNPGSVGGGMCAGSNCDTQGYVAAVNAAALCGYTDWRLPNRVELQSIVATANQGTGTPTVDAAFFPNLTAGAYWAASNFAGNAAAAWVVHFDDGRATWREKDTPRAVVVVRGGR